MPSNKPRKDITASYKRINALSDEHKAVLHSMFYEGKGVPAIIKTFQEGLGIWTDVKAASLQQFLYRYKYDVIDKNIVAMPPRGGYSPAQIQTLEVLSEKINVLEEMAALVMGQKHRVRKMMDREKDMPMLFNTLGGEMKTLAGFVKDFAELSFELGTLKRAPKTTTITANGDGSTTVESEGRETVTVALSNSAELQSAADTFFKILDTIEVEARDVTDAAPAGG